ncbi:hypothetical protein C3486_35605 [Streptomyces sp. Ru73]|uniref:hypothetical protein n=1 Tax=Streptomyces sp. Ru73 TaxID=2080748 RepID=UPI000CDDE687|nr:hypothetical protein [Streptomyces sp. Ru73]POX36054.1 hypothetical protein C3486_35605 [Streptomyces sp. Ru73]
MSLAGLAPEPPAAARPGGSTQGRGPERGAPPSGRPGLAVGQRDLAAIGEAAYAPHQRLGKDGDHARLSSLRAASALRDDFGIGRALDHVTTRWVTHLRTLLDACAHVSRHPDFTRKLHAGQEQQLGTVFSGISALDAGFTERRRR